MNDLRESYTAIRVIHNCAECKSCLAEGPFLQHNCEGVDHFTPSIPFESITRGENVVNAYKICNAVDFTHKQIFKTFMRDNLGGGTL